jgi:hypothetical protein
MIDIVIKSLDDELPTRGTKIKASNDLIKWEEKYYVQLETDNNSPFVCVDMERDIHLPSIRGKKYKYILKSIYEVSDLVKYNNLIITRDGLYTTEVDKVSKKIYWERTSFAKQIGITSFFINRTRDIVDVDNITNAIEILNKITK